MKNRHWLVLALGSMMVLGSGFSHFSRYGRADLFRLSEDLAWASARFRDSAWLRHRNGYRLSQEARDLSRSAEHFARAVRSRGPDHVRLDFQEVARNYVAARRAFHSSPDLGRPDFEPGGYHEFVRNWAEVAYSYEELNTRLHGLEGGPVDDPYGRQEIIRCKSEEYRYNECRASGRIADLRIQRRKSDAACVEGRTFGSKGDRIWVDRGCDAEFRVTLDR